MVIPSQTKPDEESVVSALYDRFFIPKQDIRIQNDILFLYPDHFHMGVLYHYFLSFLHRPVDRLDHLHIPFTLFSVRIGRSVVDNAS